MINKSTLIKFSMLAAMLGLLLWMLDLTPSKNTISPGFVQILSLEKDKQQETILPQSITKSDTLFDDIESVEKNKIHGDVFLNSLGEPMVGFVQAIKVKRTLTPLVLSPLVVEHRTLFDAIETARTEQGKAPEHLGSAILNPFALIPR